MERDPGAALLEAVRLRFPGIADADLLGALDRRLTAAADASPLDAAAGRGELALSRDLSERMKEISALQTASQLIRQRDPDFEGKLPALAAIVASAFQYPQLASVRIEYARMAFATPGFTRTGWILTGVARGNEGDGRIEVSYPEDPTGSGEPFLAEEASLLTSLAEMLTSGTDSVLSEERGTLARDVWDYQTWEWRRGAQDGMPPETYYSTMAGLPPGRWFGPARTLEEFDQADIARSTSEVAALVRRERPGDSVSFEVRTLAGQWRWSAVRLIRDSEGLPLRLVGISMDTTERHILNEQLRQSQKMEALGRLAGGVAHDFGNYLTVISSAVQLLEAHDDTEDPEHPLVMEIHKATDSASAVTGQLLSFSRRKAAGATDIHLGILVEQLSPVLRRAVGRDVTIQLAINEAVGLVRADPGRMEQVLLNLAVNGRDAMPRGGILTVEVRDADGDHDFLGVAQAWTHGATLLRVADTGVGMDESTLSRLFEPFFTTKPEGQGTGLGLATVFQVVRDCGGFVTVDSSPGHGASFTVLLPRVADLLAGPPPCSPGRNRRYRGRMARLLQ